MRAGPPKLILIEHESSSGFTIKRQRRQSEPLAAEHELPAARAPKQFRSAGCLQRIADAGRELFLSRDYEEVTVADLAQAAGVSVGTFYARFPSKEHLVVFLVAGLTHELGDRLGAQLDPFTRNGASLRQVVSLYLEETARAFLLYRGLLRPAALIARQTRDPELIGILSRFNRNAHTRLELLLLERMGRPRGRRAAVAVRTAMLAFSAAMREVLLYGEPVSRLSPAHEELLAELTNMSVAYLAA